MRLTSLRVAELIDAFRSTNPTPGGGSAAALAGAVGAALLAMVAAMPKNRAASEDDAARLRGAAGRSSTLSDALLELVDRDSDAYDAVVSAYRLPKGSDDEKAARATAIAAAMRKAVAAPLETMQRAADALAMATVVAQLGTRNAASDVEVAIELLVAAARGARANVEINLESLSDATYAGESKAEVERLARQCTDAAAEARLVIHPRG